MFDFLTELGLPEEAVSFFFTFFIGAIAVSAVIGIAIYLLESISVYKMAKSAEIKNPWLAFIPVANDWVFGTLAEKYKKKNGVKSARFGIILTVLSVIELVCSAVMLVFMIIVTKNILDMAYGAVENSTEVTPEQLAALIPIIIIYFVLIAVSMAYLIVTYIAMWRIYASFDKANATLYIVLSVLFSISSPIILFIIRNRKPEFDPHNNMPYFSGTFQG